MHSEAGQSLLEVVTASAVGILVVAALTYATIFSLRNATFAKNSTQATKLAQEGLEKIRTLRDRNGAIYYVYNPKILADVEMETADTFNELWDKTLICPAKCYFFFDGTVLKNGTTVTFEDIPPNFKRQFQIENEGSSYDQKKVTVIVRWTDFAGDHESRLTTIFRKL